MILIAETFKRFGYCSTTLLPESHKNVIWKCNDCGVIKIKEYRNTKNIYCIKCLFKGKRNPNYGNHKLAGNNNPMYGKLGKESPGYIDGRTNKKYYCKTCKSPISNTSALYKNGECKKCAKTGLKLSKQTRDKISNIRKMNWNNEKYRKNMLSKILKGNNLSPNKPEQKLEIVLKTLFKNKYKFVGDGKVIINRFCPDFINKKDNKIIEMYGDYWHNLPEYIERDKRRVKVYKKYGYKLLIVWQHELQDLDLLTAKLILFQDIL